MCGIESVSEDVIFFECIDEDNELIDSSDVYKQLVKFHEDNKCTT